VLLDVDTVCLVIEKVCDHREVSVEAEVIVEQRAYETNYSKTCLKRNAIFPVVFFRFHRFPFYKGLCFNKTKYKKI
jgi:hypothetical protein